jgi:hypothetical protein
VNGAAASLAMAIAGIGLRTAQLCVVRPLLSRPSDRVLAGGAVARSATPRIHIAPEAAKAVAVAADTLLLPG